MNLQRAKELRKLKQTLMNLINLGNRTNYNRRPDSCQLLSGIMKPAAVRSIRDIQLRGA
jgi:hypothetical protein